ncbi:MAG: NAD(P)/FAD-dependent oxidoreductase [Haloferacaceae archaeon]
MGETTVVVAGAGLAGLVTARRLADAGADVTVFERRPTVGGRVRTRERDGFTLDYGFQVLFTAYPAVEAELDLDALDLRRFRAGACIARPGERSILADPLRDPGALVESLFNREVTTGDKFRTLALRRRLANRDVDDVFAGTDESISAYLYERGFSERFVERFVAPFYGGITLDRSLSTSKRVFEYTFKMLTEGAAAVPAAGMGAIPEQLADGARAAGATVHTGEAVTDVADGSAETDDGEGDVTVTTDDRTVTADAAVVATDPPTARELTGVSSIPTEGRGCVTQYYSLPDGPTLDAGKRLLLNAADGWPNTVAPLSAVAPEYAPDDRRLFAATFVDPASQDRSDADLFDRATSALQSWYPERSFDGAELLHTDRIPFAQFAQPPGVHESLPDVRAPGGRVYLAGDYTAWSSIQGALESGRAAAEAVRADC